MDLMGGEEVDAPTAPQIRHCKQLIYCLRADNTTILQYDDGKIIEICELRFLNRFYFS